MTISEVCDFVENYTNRLNMPGLGYQIETSQNTQSAEVSFYLSGDLKHVVVIDTTTISVVYNGQYEKLEEQSYKTKLELFCYLTQILLGVYTDYSYTDLLSIVLSRHIDTWRQYVTVLFSGQPVDIEREGDSLKITGNNTHYIDVTEGKVKYYSTVLAEAEYEDFSELLIALTTIIGFIMTNEGLDLTLFDTIDDTMNVPLPEDSDEMGLDGGDTFDTDINFEDAGSSEDLDLDFGEEEGGAEDDTVIASEDLTGEV